MIKGFVSNTVRVLNQPHVKETVKNVAGSATFVFGLVAIYDLARIPMSQQRGYGSSKLEQISNKVILICEKTSLILSACVSRQGVSLISFMVKRLPSHELFGPNASFAVNPYHPRHVASILAVILSIPPIVQSMYKKITRSVAIGVPAGSRLMIVFNTMTSRPTLHVGNRVFQSILKSL